jgi:Ca2+-binding RTX toxin-like protein
MANRYNVKDYGAIGDSAADDTQAIQAAIDAAAAAGGGTVFVPAGDYRLTTQGAGTVLVLKDNVVLQGQDASQVRLWLDSAHSTGDIDGVVRISGTHTAAVNLQVDAGSPYDGVVNGWSVDAGVQVRLDNISASNATGVGIDLRAAGSQVTLSNATAMGNNHGGIVAAGLVNSTISDTTVDDNGDAGLQVTGALALAGILSYSNMGDGIVILGDAQGTAASLKASASFGNGRDGVRVQDATAALIERVSISDNGAAGLSVRNAQDTQVIASELNGNALQANTAELLLIDSHGSRIAGNTFASPPSQAVGAPAYAIEERGDSDANRVDDNLFASAYSEDVHALGQATRAFNNTSTWVTYGTAGSDNLSYTQSAFDTRLYGGAGNDVLFGGQGNDTLIGGTGADRMNGFAGQDTFRFTALTDSYRTATASFADTIAGFNAQQDRLDLTALGLSGLGDGHNGSVALSYNAAKNLTYLKSFDADAQGQRFELALEGDWRTALSDANFLPLVAGTPDADRLYGTTHGRDTLIGDDGADVLSGRGSDDRLEGSAGADRLIGGAGADTFVYTQLTDSQVDASGKDQGRDLIVDFSAAEQDQVDLSALGFTGLGDGRGTTLALSYDSTRDITRLSSLEEDNAGNRFQIAFNGNHLLDLGSNAVQFALPQVDQVSSHFGGQQARIIGTEGSDTLTGSSAQERIFALGGDDVVKGAEGTDFIIGGQGADRLTGGSGADYFIFESVEDSYRTADTSHSDLITDFGQGLDALSVSALGYTGIGDGFDGTLKIDYNAALDRTYIRDLAGDDQGRFFQVALTGDQTGHLRYNNMGFADPYASTAIEIVGVAGTVHSELAG